MYNNYLYTPLALCMQQEYTILIELSLNGRVVEKHRYIEHYKRAYILSKKVTHNILVYRQVQIIVAVTCVLYVSYVI